MRVLSILIVVGSLALSTSPSASAVRQCPLEKINGARELHETLSLRAVEVVKRAANATDRQAALIAPNAIFSLGAGDVGRPLGLGVLGVRQLAKTMNADTYRFLGWDYMDGPVNSCTEHKVEVEFTDSAAKLLSRVEFTFDMGRVVKAEGWQRSFETGRLKDRTTR
jgi:hypothetical protein